MHYDYMTVSRTSVKYTAISIKVVLKGKRSNMSAKGLSGKTSFIPEYITIHRFSTKFKIRSCFLMNINRD